MTAIFKKELASYLHSVTGWLFMAATIGFFAMYASVYNMLYGFPYIAYPLDAILILFFVTIPILSMRIMADERRQKTDQLLLTSPISIGKLVLGKYLSMAVIFLIPVVIFCLFPLFLSRYGSVPMVESYVAILAFALYGLAAIAVGMFISSLTENLVIAAVITFGVLFLTYMMQGIKSLISSTGNLLTEFLGIFDFYSHYSSMVSSVSDVTGNSRLITIFDVTSVIYFLSVVILLLFFTAQSIQKRRYTVSVQHFSLKNAAMGAYSSVTIVIVIALMVVINLIVGKLPSKYTSIDVSANQLYAVSEQTQSIVGTLKEEVTIYVLASEENADSILKQTLDRYQELSDNLQVKYINPLVNPRFASGYTTESVSVNSLIVETQKRYKVIPYETLYETQVDYSGYTYQQNVTGYDGEGQITSAISYCTGDDMPKIYIIAGHNEYTFDSGFTSAIEKENITYETISLMDYNAVPEDAECILIHAPEKDFSKDDADKVIAYLNNGGKAVITTEYVTDDQPNFERILSEYGMTIQRGCVVDNNAENFYQAQFLLLPNVVDADETKGLGGEYSYVMAPFAQAVNVPENSVENLTYTKLLTTSQDAVLKSGSQEIATFAAEEGEPAGTFCIGVKAEKTLEEKTGVMYVFSSAQLFTDQYDSYVAGNNKQLFVNIMGTIADHEVTVAIPVKSYEMQWLTVAEKDVVLVKTVGMILIPVALVITGLVIWLRRRRY